MRPEVKVGLLTIAALVVLTIMVFYINEIKVGERRHGVIVEFDRVVGVKEGAKVKLSGVDIGKVTRAGLGEKSIFLHLEVPQNVVFPQESQFIIGTMGLMGEAYVGVERSPTVELALSLSKTDHIHPGGPYLLKHSVSEKAYSAKAVRLLDGKEPGVVFSLASALYPSSGETVLVFPADDDNAESIGTAVVLPPVKRFVAVAGTEGSDVVDNLVKLSLEGTPLDVRLNVRGIDRYYSATLERPPRVRVDRTGLWGFPLKAAELIVLVFEGRVHDLSGASTDLEIMGTALSAPIKARLEGELFKGDSYWTVNEFITEGGNLIHDIREDLVPEGQKLLAEARSTVKSLSGAIDGVKEIEQRFTETFEPEKIREAIDKTIERIDMIGENLEKAAGNVVKATDGIEDFIQSVKNDISTVRDRVEILSEKIEDLVGTIDGTISENRDTIHQAIQDAKAFTANLKDVSEDVKNDVKYMVRNFRKSSDRVERMLQKLEEDQKLPETTGRILMNVEESSQNVKKATTRINEFVHDENLEHELRMAIQGMGDLSGRVDSFLGKFKQTRFDLDFLLGFDNQDKETFGDCNMRVFPLGGENYFLAGSSNIGSEDTLNLQYGVVCPRYTTRVGIIKSSLGVGLDYRLMEKLVGSIEVHDLVTTRVDTSLLCPLSTSMGVFVKVEDVTRNDSGAQNFNVGVVNTF